MRLAIGLAGAAAGNALLPGFGGQVGFALGTYAGTLLFGDDMDTKGPRIEDGKVTTSAYGQIVPVIYGVYPASGNVMDASEIREKKNKESGKGSGPTNTTYEYFGDLDVIVCEGIADAVLLIRANGEVIFDASPDAEVVQKEWLEFEFYNGAEDQPVDPTFEGLRGTDSTPNYGGTCHVVFKNFPYSQFGNQFAINFEFVVARNAIPQTTFQQTELDPIGISTYGFGIVEPYTGLLIFPMANSTPPHTSGVVAVDPYSRQVAWALNPIPGELHTGRFTSAALRPKVVTTETGESYAIPGEIGVLGEYDGVNQRVYEIDPETGSLIRGSDVVATGDVSGLFVVYDLHYQASATAFVIRDNGTFAGYTIIHGFDTWEVLEPPPLWFFDAYIETNGLGKILIPLQDQVQASTVFSVAVLDSITLVYSAETVLPSSIVHAIWTGESWWCVGAGLNGNIILMEVDDQANLLSSIDVLADYGIADNFNIFRGEGLAFSEESNSFFVQGNNALYEFHIADMAQQPTQYNLQTNTLYANAYHTETGRIWYAPNSTNYATSANLFAKAGNGVPLSTVVNDLSLNGTRLDGNDIDTVALDSITVSGLGISQAMARRNVISLLQLAYLFDYVPRSGVMTGLLRGSLPVTTLTEDHVGAYVDGGDPVSPWTINRIASEQLPRQVEVTFSDPDHNYEASTQHATRQQSVGGRVQRLNLPLSLTNDEGSQVADIYLHLANVEAETYETTTMPSTIDNVQPGNVLTVDYDGVEYTFRSVDASIIDGRMLSLKGSREVPDLFNSYAVGGSPREVDNNVKALGATILWPMDIPMLRTQDDDIGAYLAATSYTPGWPGAVIYRSTDGTSYAELFSMGSSATMGSATNVPLSNKGWFEGTQFNFNLNVSLISGELESTAASLPTYAAWGHNGQFEIIAFNDVTLEPNGTWTIHSASRGLMDSQNAMELHTTTDQFVVLSEAFISRVYYSAASIDQIEILKATTIGRPVNTGSPVPYAFGAESKVPFMPVNLSGVKDIGGTEDWTITWMRQDRIETRLFWEPPMSETTEAYQLLILNEAGHTIRTVDIVGGPSYVYTLAQQQADGWDNRGFLHFSVAQVSSLVGPGHVGEIFVGNYFGYPPAVLIDNPGNYYMLDDLTGTEAVNEISGPNAYPAQYMGTYTLDQPPLRTAGSSVRFNPGYIAIDAKNAKADEVGAFEFFFQFDAYEVPLGIGLVTFVAAEGNINNSLSVFLTEGGFVGIAIVDGAGTQILTLYSTSAMVPGQQYQCIVNIAYGLNDTVELYINGALEGSETLTGNWALQEEWYFGADMARTMVDLVGYLDDISLYTDKLTQDQRDNHFARGGTL